MRGIRAIKSLRQFIQEERLQKVKVRRLIDPIPRQGNREGGTWYQLDRPAEGDATPRRHWQSSHLQTHLAEIWPRTRPKT